MGSAPEQEPEFSTFWSRKERWLHLVSDQLIHWFIVSLVSDRTDRSHLDEDG